MPAGIISDFIQQHKAIFEGEPIQIADASGATTSDVASDVATVAETSGRRTGVEQASQGNRNSVIYAAASDGPLGSVGRELTGKLHSGNYPGSCVVTQVDLHCLSHCRNPE